MRSLVYISVQLSVILLVAPLVNGIIGKVKALSQKRKGAPLLQMYFDILKLLKKNSVVSETASWIFKAAPYIFFASAAAAALLVPVSTAIPLQGLPGDAIMLFSIFALGRFFMMAAALDTGSTFGGMGSSREAMISSLIEPSILVSIFTIGLICKSSSLPDIMISMMGVGFPLANSAFILTFLSLLIIIIAETSRIPVDDPTTHLELTMVHEAMLLEYSGRSLALMEYGAAVKQLVFITLLVNVLMPTDQLISISGFGALALSLGFYFIKVIFISLLIAVIEVNTVKYRVFSIPNLAALAFILAFIGFLQFFVFGGIYA